MGNTERLPIPSLAKLCDLGHQPDLKFNVLPVIPAGVLHFRVHRLFRYKDAVSRLGLVQEGTPMTSDQYEQLKETRLRDLQEMRQDLVKYGKLDEKYKDKYEPTRDYYDYTNGEISKEERHAGIVVNKYRQLFETCMGQDCFTTLFKLNKD